MGLGPRLDTVQDYWAANHCCNPALGGGSLDAVRVGKARLGRFDTLRGFEHRNPRFQRG
jgi:hypothetical protein